MSTPGSSIRYFSSAFNPICNLPEVSTWSFIFDDKATNIADKKIYVDASTGESLTRSELQSIARSFAYVLTHTMDLKQGDTLLLIASNSLFFPAVVLATQAAAVICSPANALSTSSELVYQITDSGAKAVICGLDQLSVASCACEELGLHNLFTLERTSRQNSPYRSIWEVCQPDKLLSPHILHFGPSAKVQVSLLCYSSGTTGRPKGVKLTHYNITSAILQAMVLAPSSFHSREVWIATLPLTHIYALFYNIFVALYVGIEVVIMNKFTLHEFTANIHSFRATACHIVPPIAVKLAKEIGSNIHDFPSLREWRSSAAPLGRDLTKSLQLQWRVPVQGLYGMTETTAVIALTDRGNLTNPSGAVGRLAPNLEAKTVDGELCLKGPNITIGYHNRPEANAATFDAEGYMHTGDIVQVDDEGFIYVVDRMKELIKYNGFQVAPAEIEDHLLHHELIQDAAVVGVNNFSRSTELPLAFVVPLSGSVGHGECSAEEMANIIMEYLAARVSPHKKLRGGIIFVTAIPKSPSGKIMRRQLRDYANGKKESLPELEVLRFGAPVPPL